MNDHRLMQLLKLHSSRFCAGLLAPMHFCRQPRLLRVQDWKQLPISTTQPRSHAFSYSAHCSRRQICWAEARASRASSKLTIASAFMMLR